MLGLLCMPSHKLPNLTSLGCYMYLESEANTGVPFCPPLKNAQAFWPLPCCIVFVSLIWCKSGPQE